VAVFRISRRLELQYGLNQQSERNGHGFRAGGELATGSAAAIPELIFPAAKTDQREILALVCLFSVKAAWLSSNKQGCSSIVAPGRMPTQAVRP